VVVDQQKRRREAGQSRQSSLGGLLLIGLVRQSRIELAGERGQARNQQHPLFRRSPPDTGVVGGKTMRVFGGKRRLAEPAYSANGRAGQRRRAVSCAQETVQFGQSLVAAGEIQITRRDVFKKLVPPLGCGRASLRRGKNSALSFLRIVDANEIAIDAAGKNSFRGGVVEAQDGESAFIRRTAGRSQEIRDLHHGVFGG